MNKSFTVMTLDAGGTNFVFSAYGGGHELVDAVTFPSHADDLDKCLTGIIHGFEHVKSQLDRVPEAISFGFPGPADYQNGIIGDLGNLPGFRGGVALGPMLEEHFKIPVFINNDGDLFAYGEASYGLLPWLNSKIRETGGSKAFNNLAGVTLGTGFGGGIVRNGDLFLGDNGAAAEIWLLRSLRQQNIFIEEDISARAIIRNFHKAAGEACPDCTPLMIYQIAKGDKPGDREAALFAFEEFGISLGAAVNDLITMIDGPVVIGGGLANAAELFFPAMFKQLNGHYQDYQGKDVPRLELEAINLDDEAALSLAITKSSRQVKVPNFNRMVHYNSHKWVGVGVSKLGASRAIALGAYAFAAQALSKH